MAAISSYPSESLGAASNISQDCFQSFTDLTVLWSSFGSNNLEIHLFCLRILSFAKMLFEK